MKNNMNEPVFLVRRNDELIHYGVKGMKWDESKRKLTVTDENMAKEIMKQYESKSSSSSSPTSSKVTDKKTDTKTTDSNTKKKTTDTTSSDSKKYADIVNQVINGKFGNGQARVSALKKAGQDYEKIQNLVNVKLLGKSAAQRIAARKKKTK